MKKFVSKSKLSKKARKEKEAENLLSKILQNPSEAAQRNTWGDLNPITRVIQNKKKYNRKKDKKVMNQACTSE